MSRPTDRSLSLLVLAIFVVAWITARLLIGP